MVRSLDGLTTALGDTGIGEVQIVHLREPTGFNMVHTGQLISLLLAASLEFNTMISRDCRST